MIAPLALVAVVVAILVTIVRIPVSHRDVAWLAGSTPVASDEAAVYSRYLRRHRVHRLVGGVFGLALAVVVGLSWFGTVTIGIRMGNPLGDLLFCGLAGVLVGALSAESFRLGQSRSAVVAASLEVRGSRVPALPVRVARAVVLASLVLGVLVLAIGGAPAPLAAAVVGLVVALMGEATRSAVTARRRPLLSQRAHRVDDRIREFATGSVSRLQLAAAILTVGWTLALVPPIENGLLMAVRLVALLAALVSALVFLHGAAPRPPRRWAPA